LGDNLQAVRIKLLCSAGVSYRPENNVLCEKEAKKKKGKVFAPQFEKKKKPCEKEYEEEGEFGRV